MKQVDAAHAIEQLIQEYGKLIFHLIYCLTGEWEESQDLTQETFLSALRAIDAAQHARGKEFHAKAWLMRIAVNTARMYLRRRRLVRFSSLSHMAQDEERASEGGIRQWRLSNLQAMPQRRWTIQPNHCRSVMRLREHWQACQKAYGFLCSYQRSQGSRREK